ncbi:serine/threonine-protein kinase [Embleya sp. AB8]|uniref:serine/threonine-protein kinase n=1 Tax=Embleya sp. AB8 TaxID=3156304 RepID=UPI003C7704A5
MKPLEPEDPRQIGDYRVFRVLGAGGMGRVFLGRNRGGRVVAIKVVRAELADDPGFRERFRREVDAARRVGGAWTAPVLDADTEARTPWVVTGYVAGPSVSEAVSGRGPLPEETVRTLGAGLAEALTAVHAAGLVHRDIKPSNVLLSLDGPRVIDFGISRAMDASVLTRSGHTVGSPGFMSPEQVDGRDIGPPTDVFSLGSVLVFAATGVGPFGEGSGPALMYRIVAQEPRLDELPPWLREVVAACMTKQAASRPSPAEVLAALAPGGTSDLVAGNWLPADLTTALSRRAIELLELDENGTPDAGTFVATGGGPPTWDDRSDSLSIDPNHIKSSQLADVSQTYVPERTPPPPPPRVPPKATRRHHAWLIPLVAALVAGAVTATVLLWPSGGKDDPAVKTTSGGPAAAPEQSPTGTANPAAAGGSSGKPGSADPPSGSAAMPQSYYGTWTGTATSALGSLSQITLTLTGGKVGDTKVGVSKLTATGVLGERADCAADLELLSVTADKGVEMTSHLTRNQGCADGPVIVKQTAPDKLAYTSPASSLLTSTSTGTLTRTG